MNRKGFIPLLIIVIVLIIAASAGTGVVLHKQGRLSFFTDDVLETTREIQNTPTSQEEILKQELEKARIEAAKLRQVTEGKQQQEDAQIKIEKCKITASQSAEIEAGKATALAYTELTRKIYKPRPEDYLKDNSNQPLIVQMQLMETQLKFLTDAQKYYNQLMAEASKQAEQTGDMIYKSTYEKYYLGCLNK